MRLIFNDDARVAGWVSERIGHPISPPYVAIGMTDDGRLYCGGAVFNCWNGANIELTIAMERPVTRGILRALYHYVFIQSKATRLSAHTKRSNKKVARLLPKLGFQFEGVAKRYYGPNKPDDALCYALFPDTTSKFYADSPRPDAA